MARGKKNPWSSTSEVLLWILFVMLLFPAAFAGYAVGHYTSLGKPSATVTMTVGSPTTTPSTTTTAMTTTSSSGGGNVAAGKADFASAGCSSCHTLAEAGASGQVGPNLDQAPSMDAKTDNNMALAAFVKESIVNPNAYISKVGGPYSPGIMPQNYGTSLSSQEISDLVALILSGSHK